MKIINFFLSIIMAFAFTGCATASYEADQQDAQEKAYAKNLAQVKVTRNEPQNCRLVDYYYAKIYASLAGIDPRDFYAEIQKNAIKAKGNVAVMDVNFCPNNCYSIGRIYNCPSKK